jgi:hypothetical protein
MYDTYQRMVGESVFYRHQIYRYRVKEMECTAQALKEARAMITTLEKERRKDKAKIQELSEIIHEQCSTTTSICLNWKINWKL